MTAAAIEDLIKVGSIEVRFVVDEEDSSGSVTAFEVRVPPGSGVAPHSHAAFDEIVYGLAGILTLTVDGRTAAVAPGQSAFVPRGSIHSFENLGKTDSQVLSVATPGLFRPAYFRELAAVIDRAPGSPPDPTALHEVMTRHGVTPAR